MYAVTVTKLVDGKKQNKQYGITSNLPQVNHNFLFIEQGNNNFGGESRMITTTKVKEVTFVSEQEVLVRTQNSVYIISHKAIEP